MSQFRPVFRTLNSTSVVLSSGFMVGFVYELKFSKKTLEHPIKTLFNASIGGCLTYFGAAIVHDLLPRNLRFTIPLLACASCSYYLYKASSSDSKI